MKETLKNSTLGALALLALAVPASAAPADGFVLVKGGTFTMGSPASERLRHPDEVQHKVTVSPFYVDPYEVTQESFESVMKRNPSRYSGKNLPVEQVTWFDAIEYCNKRSEQAGLVPVYKLEGGTVEWDRAANGYRLLTEAEWEYAARAGTASIFCGKDQITSEDANFQGHYPYLIEENYVRHRNAAVVTSEYRGGTIAVNSLKPNAFGLYNMMGNVAEWVFDYYGAYDTKDAADPTGAASGFLRVNRGGSYNDFAKHLRMAYRSATNPQDPDYNLGFRVARNAEPGNGVVRTSQAFEFKIPKNPKILVAYYSYSGNTENGARIIAKKTGGDLFEIEMQSPYRGNIYDVSQKDLNGNVRPKLKGRVKNMESYDVILLGYPTWWATMPMPVVTFLESYDFAGKAVVTFSSHGGTGFGESVSDLSKMLPQTAVGQALEYNYSGGGSLERDISAWLKLNGVPEK